MPGRTMILLFAATIACSAGCGGSSATSPGGSTGTQSVATTAVTMSGLQFTPATISVSPGSVVTWTNKDNTAHNVTIHSNMSGTVTVQ
jgi:plastocyanin